MPKNITSAYDGETLTVDSMLKDPTWIPQRVINNLDGAFVESALFRNGGSNDSGVVAFREAADPFLDEEAEEVAEFAEIPVSTVGDGKVRSVIGQKTAKSIRVSYEMRHENKVDRVSQQITALQRTMIRSGVNAALAAFNAANTPNAPASAAWTGSGGDPSKDIFDAIEEIEAAGVDGDETKNFGYSPNAILAHPRAITTLIRNDKIQSKYIGDLASENPLYKGTMPITICGLTVLRSRWMDPTKVTVLETGVAGFYSDTYPLQMTPVYEEGGNSGAGGPTMSWRSDAFRKRILGVDNPGAVFTITGIS
ncbi:hypothetical protein GS436_02900 [Rhodococcus hoagii]|uniref:Major capsid protein n=1 Tax=Rhodococcus hoagii TaxID=43767 RepID=A0AAE3B950_RHOHA|nr:hypothetical protein [Prescottella equi]MBM4713636.1 hypothetical protein [Prescottella equi]NKS11979.1 hypothetical protein [Prescottella equi]